MNIDKVHIYGNYVKKYIKYKKEKKGLILKIYLKLIDLINKRLNNNDYLMIKGSNSTGLFKIIPIIKIK